MINYKILPFIVFILLINLFNNKANAQSKIDAYNQTLKLGDQIWMAENVEVTKFRNGDTILYAKNRDEWRDADKKLLAAWCYPNFDERKKDLGIFYNIHAVNDSRGLAPKGWAIPTDYDWDHLINYVGDEINGGKKLMELPLYLDDELSEQLKGSFFNKLPGAMNFDGYFPNESTCEFWSATKIDDANWFRRISKNGSIKRYYLGIWGEGMSVRCIKSETSINKPMVYLEHFENMDTTNSTIKIGDIVWGKKNLAIKTFRNGDTIKYIDNDADWEKAGLAKTPAWCYFNDRPINGKNYGVMYNAYAIDDPRGLAPIGWHIASLADWNSLINNLNLDSNACETLQGKDKLDLLFGGGRNNYGAFHYGLGGSTCFWTSTSASPFLSKTFYLSSEIVGCKFHITETNKKDAFYVRCVKD
jgi:uncharacterized protein (TIGR02145 family)